MGGCEGAWVGGECEEGLRTMNRWSAPARVGTCATGEGNEGHNAHVTRTHHTQGRHNPLSRVSSSRIATASAASTTAPASKEPQHNTSAQRSTAPAGTRPSRAAGRGSGATPRSAPPSPSGRGRGQPQQGRARLRTRGHGHGRTRTRTDTDTARISRATTSQGCVSERKQCEWLGNGVAVWCGVGVGAAEYPPLYGGRRGAAVAGTSTKRDPNASSRST